MTMLVSCVLAVPTLAFAANPTVYEVRDSAEFNSAVAAINGKTSGEYVIKLTDDIESYGGASFSSACTTTILGNRHTITLGEEETYFGVSRGARLNLGSADGSDVLTISGGNSSHNDRPGVCRLGLGVPATCTPA